MWWRNSTVEYLFLSFMYHIDVESRKNPRMNWNWNISSMWRIQSESMALDRKKRRMIPFQIIKRKCRFENWAIGMQQNISPIGGCIGRNKFEQCLFINNNIQNQTNCTELRIEKLKKRSHGLCTMFSSFPLNERKKELIIRNMIQSIRSCWFLFRSLLFCNFKFSFEIPTFKAIFILTNNLRLCFSSSLLSYSVFHPIRSHQFCLHSDGNSAMGIKNTRKRSRYTGYNIDA